MLRNTAFLALAQVVGMPLSLLLSAITARYLGPVAVGYIYIATTSNGVASIAVDWGQAGALPALVATNNDQSGRLLGTALVWRAFTSVIVSAALLVLSYFLGYNSQILLAIGLVSVGYAFSALSNACQYAIFGFERTDVAARRQFVEQVLSLVIVGAVLILGGHLTAMLIASAIVTAIVFAYVWPTLRPAGIGRLSFDPATLRTLLHRGTPFVFFSVAMTLQPYVDTLFLSRLAAESIGWYAASRKLLGVLVFPAAVVGGAIYPTLCRLHATDFAEFKAATIGSLRSMSLLVFPVALGCALFPEIGIAVFSRRSFGPAEGDLRVLSLFLFLVYFSMPLGNCLLAAGKQRVWAAVQFLSVGVSLVLDPILIPWFERRYANGGLGVCWTAVLSELLAVSIGIFLAPRGLFGPRLRRSALLAGVSGLAMAATARALSSVNSFAAAPVALAAYATTLWLTGGIEKSEIAAARAFVSRKLLRGTRAAASP
jgi:O-antigen/teichoic acid export membrane protein